MSGVACPLCEATVGLEEIYTLEPDAPCPTHCCVVVDTRNDALAWPRGELAIARCSRCGFVFNTVFDPSTQRFGAGYEESQAHSGVFSAFERSLVDDLTRRLGVRDKSVLEIGCGKGSFLRALCVTGSNTGVGYDPSYEARVPEPPGIRFERKLYTAATREAPADVVVCRHTLEHIRDVRAFGRLLFAATKPGGTLFVEAPAWERILDEGAFWDLYYEHACYFDASSLEMWARASGFEDVSVRRVYDGQYLVCVARRGDETPTGVPKRGRLNRPRFGVERDRWRGAIERAVGAGRDVALWGSGSKGVGFLAGVGTAREAVVAAVDINPHRHGRFMPGVGVEIVAPEALCARAPGLVIAMNKIYIDEIRAECARIGVAPDLVALGQG